MKRPKHMTLRELIALPILRDREKLKQPKAVDRTDGYGGAFRDERGHVWGTVKVASGWVRFPAHLPLLN